MPRKTTSSAPTIFTFDGHSVVGEPQEFPLEMLGPVAARLLIGDDYGEAARRAQMLLIACDAANRCAKGWRKDLLDEAKSQEAELASGLPAIVDLDRAAREITGTKTTTDAFPLLRKWLEKHKVKVDPFIEDARANGLPRSFVIDHRKRFAMYREIGLPDVIRKAPKGKILAADPKPQNATKVTKSATKRK